MTDLIGSLLDRMSSVFNDTRINTPINIQEDNTLKWKSLINNNYARKDGTEGTSGNIKGSKKKPKGSSATTSSNNSSEDEKKSDPTLTQAIADQEKSEAAKETLVRAKLTPTENEEIVKEEEEEEGAEKETKGEEKEENDKILSATTVSEMYKIIAETAEENREEENKKILSTTIEANIDENNLLIENNQCSGGTTTDDDLKSKKVVIDDDKTSVEAKQTNEAHINKKSVESNEIMLTTNKSDDDDANELSYEQKEEIDSISKNDTKNTTDKSKPMLPSTIETTTPIQTSNMADNNSNDENFINVCDGICSDDKKITKIKNNNPSVSATALALTPTPGTSKKENQNNTSSNNNKTIDKTTKLPSDRNLRSNKTATNTTNSTSIPTQSTASTDDKKLDELEENDNGDSNSNSSQSALRKGRGRPKLDSKSSESPVKPANPTPVPTANKSKDLKTQQPEKVAEQQQQQQQSDNETIQTRGRGRVTRRAVDTPVEEKVETSVEEKKPEMVEIKKEEEVPPKRRGRSRKLLEETQQPPVEIPVAESLKVEEVTLDISNNAKEIKKEETPDRTDSQKKKRGRSKKLTSTESDTQGKNDTQSDSKSESNTQSEEAKPRLIMTIRTEKSVPKIVPSTSTSVPSPQNKKEEIPTNGNEPVTKVIIRRRGRRARPAQVKKSPRNLARESGESVLASAIARKEKQNEHPPPALRNRSLRRIKPTAKILANEELRQGFEIQNCVRLSISTENLENMERSSPVKTPEVHHDTKHDKKISTENITTKMEPPKPVKNSAEVTHVQKTVQSQQQPLLKTTNLTIDNIYPKVTTKPCRSPEEFLKEIKDSKICLHRSAEDNKKLNKKQQRKLYKMKIKHLSMLGLRRATKVNDDDDDSDSSMESESDAEEFVPTKFSKQDIAKPNITLRLRNQKSDKPSITPSRKTGTTIKRRIESDKGISEQDKRIKLTNESKADQSDDDCILVETAQTQTNFRNATGVSNGNKENNRQNLICFCLQKTKYCIKQQQTLPFSVDGKIFCCAIDEIEKRKVGCTNEISEPLINLYRPSVKVSYMILCPSHKKRLITHNCCSGCGIFCSQGTFVVCNNKHFFHRECAIKYILNTPYDPNNPHFTEPTLVLKCPHCGIDAPHFDYRVSMRCENLPVFVPHRNPLPKPAKMSIQVQKPTHQSFLLTIEKLIPNPVIIMLKNAYDKLQMRKNQPSSSSAPIDNSNLYSPKDFFYALYMKDGDEKVADIIASGFNLLTPFKDFHNGTCLHLVSNFGTITMTYLILCRANSHDFVDLMDKEMRTATMCAVVGGKNDILRLLCQCGADVTIKGPDGMTVLHLAAKVGNSEAVQIILEHYRQKATVQKLKYFIDSTDSGCWTALVWAAEHGHASIVSYLMSLGADPNICDSENNTVAHWAALSGNLETIYPLLSNCDINIQNIHGDTALHIACRQSNARICLLLLANGGNLSLKNSANETPLDCIVDPNGICGRLLKFNINLRNIGIGGWNSNFGEKTILCNDISNGRENYPIQIVRNFVPSSNAEETILPDFRYITRNILLQNTIQIDQRISQMRVCNCSDNCISDNCQCGQMSLQNWYSIDGRLISDFNFADPPMLFECNDVCGCNKLMCKNRVVQNGLKLPLTVFECEDKQKGFGVKCLSKIVKGSFIAQYIGEILTDHEADRRTDDSYFFDLGASDHCIDANFYGNVSRFFNHSCDPNIVPVRVYTEHHDMRFPKIAFFASKDIEAGEEISFDYGEKFWIVKYKFFTCHCKSPRCRYSVETINATIDEYNQRASVINLD